MRKYIMALDQGTTSSRCIIYDKKGNMMSVAQKEFTQKYPKDGRLFQRDKAEMDTGKRAGRAKEGRRRPAALWHHRDMAHMEDDRRKGPRH